jgi:parvulin-like peptidyl-prolyl isomerase
MCHFNSSRFDRFCRMTPGVLFLAMLMGGCGSGGADFRTQDTRGLERASSSMANAGSNTSGGGAAAVNAPSVASSPTIGVVNGQVLTLEQLRPILMEAGGVVAVEEVAMDRVLKQQFADAGLKLSASDVRAEEGKLIEALREAAGNDSARGDELLLRVRASRGLGPTRYAALLERNAMLRRMVASEVSVSAEQIEQGKQVRFGPRYRGRVIIARTEREAAAARGQVVGAGSIQGMREKMSELAAQSSLTSSSYPGGVTEPISPADSAYPGSLRTVIAKLQPGELSPIIALDKAFAIFLLEDVLPGNANPTAQDVEEIRRRLQSASERIAMERKARQVMDAAGVNIVEPGLRWTWENRPK